MGTVDIITGKVIAFHVADEYAVLRETFDMIIPNMSKDVLYGLEGNAARNRQRNVESGEEGFQQQ
ncbi:hypothetical protein N7508_005377 [Penicillium antarcticum]|uniref:uncharacterized protein n=1 Tax=Penicillium antarcticum TaxID=416450 RepID=UPI00239C596C|nr:uncharacterized protein N7508_005377 [Penicillium antarcticum]KAJ5306362.1 hypothetical protein N7508_005377 [Penicillium antarcticum]